MIIDLPDTTLGALTKAQAGSTSSISPAAQRAADADDVVRSIRSLDSSGVGVEHTTLARGSILPPARLRCGLAEAQRRGDVVAVRNPVTGAASWRLTLTARWVGHLPGSFGPK